MDRKQGQLPGHKREASGELLGPYELRAELARGEFTTVHLAQKQGAMGFQRLFAVKRLRSEFLRQAEHVELLLDEARLSACLHHANVVAVQDVSTHGAAYVVMDYVDGENLENLLARAGRERHPRYLAPILVDVLAGLQAVHAATGEDGQSLGLVHQAPTARHVMVGSDGSARLIDFGQARAHGVVSSHLRSDRLRVAAMAPEQALDPSLVDARSDLFIVGLVLWEALTGERLFAAESEALSFQNLLHKRIQRPSEVGLRPPRCFDAIVMRALSRESSQRYASALEMARDLREVAINQALYATPGELGQWVTALAGRQLAERRQRVQANPESEASGSGMFTAKAPAENPYGSGLIYGHGRPAFGSDGDPDKTPAFGVRPARGSDAPRASGGGDSQRPVRVMEVDGRRGRDERSSRPAPQPSPEPLAMTPSGARIAPPSARTGVQTSVPESVTPPRTQNVLQTIESDFPFGAYDDSENTHPGGFVPARPGARHTPGQLSPGAYSEVKISARRRQQGEIFEEVDTSRIDLRRSSNPPEGRLSPPPLEPRRSLRAKSDPPRQKPVTEGPSLTGGRRDSMPGRMTLPDGPVGLPMGVPAPKPASSFASPPEEGTSLDRIARRAFGEAITLPLAIDSLSPPQSAARTAAPPSASLAAESRHRGFGFWISTGLLLGVIAVASVVGVRNWSAPPQAASGGRVVESPAPPAPEPAPLAVEAVEPVQLPSAPPSAAPAEPRPAPTTLAPVVMEDSSTTPAVRPPATRGGKRRAQKAAAASAPAAEAAPAPAVEVAPVSAEIHERTPPARQATLPANPY